MYSSRSSWVGEALCSRFWVREVPRSNLGFSINTKEEKKLKKKKKNIKTKQGKNLKTKKKN